LATYLLFPLLLMAVALALIRGRQPIRAPFGVAAFAMAIALAVSSVTFDVLAFPHVPYVFFLLAAMTVVLASEEKRRPRRTAASAVPDEPSLPPPVVADRTERIDDRVPEPAIR
jgi:hypothetical protein